MLDMFIISLFGTPTYVAKQEVRSMPLFGCECTLGPPKPYDVGLYGQSLTHAMTQQSLALCVALYYTACLSVVSQ